MLTRCTAYRLFYPLLRRIRSHPVLIRGLLGVRIPRGADVAFDPTTVLLARAAAANLLPEDRSLLEMGIGAGALVSLSLADHCRRLGRSIDLAGCDCLARRVESARLVAQHNGFDADFFESNLFAAMAEADRPRQFDLILFNPPYVPTDVGEQLRMGERLTDERPMWDGGADGLAVLRRFLADACRYLAPAGRLLFGVQHVFVPDAAVVEAIDASPLKLADRYTRRGVPAEVYVLTA
ncbi:MAG: methyltransferase [Planctomycetota bacterium]